MRSRLNTSKENFSRMRSFCIYYTPVRSRDPDNLVLALRVTSDAAFRVDNPTSVLPTP